MNAYVQEHVNLLKSVIGAGTYLNEGETCALSTACGVMIRLSAYTGQMVSMADMLRNTASPFYGLECKPTPTDFEMEGDVPMPEYGDGQWPLPGVPWVSKKA